MGKGFDLAEKWQDVCISRIRELVGMGFGFRKQKDLQNAIDGLIPITPDIQGRLVNAYYSIGHRLPAIVPRAFHECSGVKCPSHLVKGYEMLKAELRQGCDLRPRMSRQVKFFDTYDGMLNDWSIQHFHLGDVKDAKHTDFIQGDKMIAYVYLTMAEAYVITIDEHGKWADQGLLETLLRDFPHALDDWKTDAKDLAFEPTVEERKELREAHVNSFVKLNGAVYVNPLGGESFSGGPAHASYLQVRSRNFLKRVSPYVEAKVLESGRWNPDQLDEARLLSFKIGDGWEVVLRNDILAETIVINADGVKCYIEE